MKKIYCTGLEYFGRPIDAELTVKNFDDVLREYEMIRRGSVNATQSLDNKKLISHFKNDLIEGIEEAFQYEDNTFLVCYMDKSLIDKCINFEFNAKEEYDNFVEIEIDRCEECSEII